MTVRLAAQRRRERRAGRRPACDAGNCHGHACGDDNRRVRGDRKGLAGHREAPRFKRPYTEVVYQPMLELLDYLRATGFKTFIVSGGSIEFMRPWAETAYGIPPEQVDSSIKTKFELRDGQGVLVRLRRSIS